MKKESRQSHAWCGHGICVVLGPHSPLIEGWNRGRQRPFCNPLAAEIQYYCTWLVFIWNAMHVYTIEDARPSVFLSEGSVFRELALELLYMRPA